MATQPRSALASLRICGIALIGLAPLVSTVQFLATGHLYYWAGAVPLLAGLCMIVAHPVLERRWARPMRPGASTFREKSIAIQIVSILAVYGFFGVWLWGFWEKPSVTTTAASAITVVALIGITICMVVINIGAHLALVFHARPEPPDERDRIIGLRGSRNAYGVLAVATWCILCLAIVGIPHGALLFAMLGAFALAELVRLSSQLVYYRLGA